MVPFVHLNGRLVEVSRLASFEVGSEFERSTVEFLQQWQQGQDRFDLYTSGSTGKPTKISIQRQQMVASANMTIEAFNLLPNDTLHLCLNTGFIAGKMMLVRAMVGNMNIVAEAPSAYPKALAEQLDTIHFTALIPLQLENLLADEPSLHALNKMKGIIIGGAPTSAELEKRVQEISAPVFATFGMTETVTHVALRRLNGAGRSKYYQVLPGIQIDLDDRECLAISGPVTLGKRIVTNDRVKLVDKTHFEWLGRIDNMINSGGIKIQLEEVERETAKVLSKLGLKYRAFAAGIPDKSLGQVLVLCLEGQETPINTLLAELKSQLPKYHAPRKVLFIDRFVETSTGKINRRETIKPVMG
ncbi:MAG: AMP-binding protein [Cytophagales bacterium]|nr:AMP-binding protein [Cytophagales bacterium]